MKGAMFRLNHDPIWKIKTRFKEKKGEGGRRSCSLKLSSKALMSRDMKVKILRRNKIQTLTLSSSTQGHTNILTLRT